MKITCQACQAKYTIADEKVVGKIVKIRCKKCGATIVVNGNEPGASLSQPPGSLPASTESGPDVVKVAEEPWTVNVDDGDQRSMTEAEVVAAYRGGVLDDETFCWRDGMADWLPLREIAPLRAACVARSADGNEGAAPRPSRTSAPPARPKSLPPSREGNGALGTIAARRAGGRAADTDLFGSAAKAGGEDEVLTSAPAGEKLIGARNESSVLFALNPLTEKAAPAPSQKMSATNEASGLIDIRQLGAQARPAPGDEKKSSRIDDIMNLGGGGAFSPSLAAPVLSAPSLEHISSSPPAMMGTGKPGKTAFGILIGGAGIFLIVAAFGLGMLLTRNRSTAGDDHERTATAASGAEVAPSAAASNGAASATVTGGHAPAATETASAAAPESTSATSPAKEAPPPKEASPAAAPRPVMAGPVAPKEAPAPAAVGSPSAPFNMGEARASLQGVAANVQSCKRGETTGSGRVEITFAPSGAVQSVVMMPGSPFEGALTAKCVEARFRGAHVPPFGGGPFTVTKSFNIN